MGLRKAVPKPTQLHFANVYVIKSWAREKEERAVVIFDALGATGLEWNALPQSIAPANKYLKGCHHSKFESVRVSDCEIQ